MARRRLRTTTFILLTTLCAWSCGDDSEDDSEGTLDSAEDDDGGSEFEVYQCTSVAACTDAPGTPVELSMPVCATGQGVNSYVIAEAGCLIACVADDLDTCISTECEPLGDTCECPDPSAGLCASSEPGGRGSLSHRAQLVVAHHARRVCALHPEVLRWLLGNDHHDAPIPLGDGSEVHRLVWMYSCRPGLMGDSLNHDEPL